MSFSFIGFVVYLWSLVNLFKGCTHKVDLSLDKIMKYTQHEHRGPKVHSLKLTKHPKINMWKNSCLVPVSWGNILEPCWHFQTISQPEALYHGCLLRERDLPNGYLVQGSKHTQICPEPCRGQKVFFYQSVPSVCKTWVWISKPYRFLIRFLNIYRSICTVDKPRAPLKPLLIGDKRLRLLL